MKKRFLFSFFVSVLLLLGGSLFAEDAKAGPSVITIENANKTEYKKDEVTGQEQIVLTGAVTVSVASGTSTTKITASRVTYNRENNILYASGSVVMEQTGGSSGDQTITASSLLFNTSTLEGIFDNGKVVQVQSENIQLPEDSTLVVSAKMFGKDSGSTVVFKNATLTFCDAPNPHWKIRASRIWLLPGTEFAFFNALLYVGEFPLLYLPAFYYPKDELIFNPVFGYDQRRGYFTQTTLYLYGRKPLDTSASGDDDDDDVSAGLYNFMKATKLKEQKREGLVLHNLDEDYKGDTNNYFKLMGDYYTTLGTMVGFDTVLKPKKYVSDIEANLKLGFSNTLFPSGDSYTTFSSKGESYTDSANFLGLETPFRYSGNIKLTVTNPLSLTLTMPFYSDPYFIEDFEDRSEYMDWIGFLLSGTEDDDEDDSTDSTVTSFTWSASASYSFKVPEVLNPWLDTFSITSLNSSIAFSSKANSQLTSNDNWKTYTPQRSFFYPSQIIPLKIAGSIKGTIINFPSSQKNSASKSVNFPISLLKPEEFKSEEEKKKKDENSHEESKENKNEEKKEESLLTKDALPSLDVSQASKITDIAGLFYSLTYTLTPQYTSQFNYDSTALTQPEDFYWTDLKSSYYQVKNPATLTSKLTFRDTFFSMSNSLSFNPVYQEHPSLDGYTTTSSKNSIIEADYAARKLDLTESNDLVFKPLIYNPLFKNSNLSYSTSMYLIKTKFIGDADNPEWEYLTTDFGDEESVTTHTLSASIAATETDKISQTLTLSTTLPPQQDKYTGTLTFTFPYTSLTFSTGIEENSEGEWEKDPFQQSLSITSGEILGSALTFTESFNYELEEDYADSLKLSLSWNNLQLAYTMAYTYGYDAAYIDGEDGRVFNGWDTRDEKEFLPETFSLAYSSSNKTFRYWKKRVTWAPSLSTSIVYDCLRPTNSYFKFVPAVSFKVNNMLTLTFSSETKNSVIYRYFQGFTNTDIDIPGETNIFKDLINSFAFWGNGKVFDPEQTKRRASGFKLKSLNITATHSLHDWDLASTFKVEPRLVQDDNGKYSYSFAPYITLSVVWKPMSSMKTEIVDEYGEWQLNP